MNRLPTFISAAMRLRLLLLALACAPLTQAADIERGKQLHDERCLLCHGLENYQAAASKIKSLDGLREMVRRWEDKLKDPFTALEREDVVAYLNVSFYKFPEQKKVSLRTQQTSAASATLRERR
jgi:hypothetical protein